MVLYARLQIGCLPPTPRTPALCMGSLCGAKPSPSAFDGPQAAPPLPLCSCYLGPEEQWQEAKSDRGWTEAHWTHSACADTVGCSAWAPCSRSWIHVQQGFMFICAPVQDRCRLLCSWHWQPGTVVLWTSLMVVQPWTVTRHWRSLWSRLWEAPLSSLLQD